MKINMNDVSKAIQLYAIYLASEDIYNKGYGEVEVLDECLWAYKDFVDSLEIAERDVEDVYRKAYSLDDLAEFYTQQGYTVIY